MKLLIHFFQSIAVALLLITPAYAYSPPPGGNIFRLPLEPRICVPPEINCPPPFFGPFIRIQLPPRLIMTPDKLLFPDFEGREVTFRFIENTNDYTRSYFAREPETEDYLMYQVSTTVKNNTGSRDGAYYVITVYGFKKIDLPQVKDFRLTFKSEVSKQNIDKLENYLNPDNGNPNTTAKLTGVNCSGDDGSHICLETFTKVVVPGKTLSSYLHQTIPLKGIRVSGNSAAFNGSLESFIQVGSPLAVGGDAGSIQGGQTISGYVPSAPIKWTDVGSKLIEQFDSNKSYNKNEVVIYDAANWNLNSRDKDHPSILEENTFSTPPEGRLWNIYVDSSKPQNHWRNDFYNIGKNKNVGTLFSGAGTVSVRRTRTEGPMPITVHGGVRCASGTRFALITKGDIVFDTPANGELNIDCGAYISLEGNIRFGNNDIKKGTVNGIFIAKGNILLPDPDRLTDTFNINPDTNILKNPPLLLRELLKIVFGVSS